MPYVMKTTGANTPFPTSVLHEMTTKQLERAVSEQGPNVRHKRISAPMAHQFVRRNGVHNTRLYINVDNRMRKA